MFYSFALSLSLAHDASAPTDDVIRSINEYANRQRMRPGSTRDASKASAFSVTAACTVQMHKCALWSTKRATQIFSKVCRRCVLRIPATSQQSRSEHM